LTGNQSLKGALNNPRVFVRCRDASPFSGIQVPENKGYRHSLASGARASVRFGLADRAAIKDALEAPESSGAGLPPTRRSSTEPYLPGSDPGWPGSPPPCPGLYSIPADCRKVREWVVGGKGLSQLTIELELVGDYDGIGDPIEAGVHSMAR